MGEITSVLRILKLRKTTFYDLITNKHTKHGGDTLKKKNASLSYLTHILHHADLPNSQETTRLSEKLRLLNFIL